MTVRVTHIHQPSFIVLIYSMYAYRYIHMLVEFFIVIRVWPCLVDALKNSVISQSVLGH